MASTTSRQGGVPLSTAVRWELYITAALDFLLGLAFLFGPELQLPLWPTPVPPLLSRFIGSIVLANGVGLVVAARQGTWEGARVIFAVGLSYGLVILAALLYHLLLAGAPAVFWGYTAADTVFVVGVGYLTWRYEGRYRAA
jgi:hypothetical protein